MKKKMEDKEMMFDDLFRDLFAETMKKGTSATKNNLSLICSCGHGKLLLDNSKGIFITENDCDTNYSCAVMKIELKSINNLVKMPIFSNIKSSGLQNQDRKYNSLDKKDQLKFENLRKSTFEK